MTAASLIERDRRKDVSMATLARELRNPVAPIANAVHIIRMSTDATPPAQPMRQ